MKLETNLRLAFCTFFIIFGISSAIMFVINNDVEYVQGKIINVEEKKSMYSLQPFVNIVYTYNYNRVQYSKNETFNPNSFKNYEYVGLSDNSRKIPHEDSIKNPYTTTWYKIVNFENGDKVDVEIISKDIHKIDLHKKSFDKMKYILLITSIICFIGIFNVKKIIIRYKN